MAYTHKIMNMGYYAPQQRVVNERALLYNHVPHVWIAKSETIKVFFYAKIKLSSSATGIPHRHCKLLEN